MPAIPGIDFSNLTDAELSQMLEDYGVNMGPVNEATRSTYERKLARLKLGHASPPTVSKYPPVDDDDEEDMAGGDDSEISFRRPDHTAAFRQPTASSTPNTNYLDTSPARLRKGVADYTHTQRVEARPGLGAGRKVTQSSTAPKAEKSESNKSLPLWVKLVALLVVMVLVYLIYSNMEPQAVNNIPGIPNKVEV